MDQTHRKLSYTPASDLLGAVEKLARAGGTDEIIEVIRAGARHLIGCDGIALVLNDDCACHYVEEDAIGPLWKGRKFDMRECVSGWSMLNRETAVIPDVSDDARVPYHLYRETFVRSLIMAPIGADQPVGALGAYWARVYQPSGYEIETVEALARATATALENANLIAALSRALTQAELARDELRHRLKNAYLAAQGLAKLSLPPDYARVFSARIGALARAHELIDQKLSHQSSIDIRELLQAELAAYGKDAPGRLTIHGPATTLKSAQAIAVGLAINELATNALKYGALATEKGRLDVTWRVDRNYLVIDWREADGPEVRTATLESFGSRLLRRLIEDQLKGTVTRSLDREGVDCKMEFPLEPVAAEPAGLGLASTGRDQNSLFDARVVSMQTPISR